MILAAERIKLSTTRSPLWTAVVVAALSLGFAALQAAAVTPGSSLHPERAAVGVAAFGVPVLMILAAMTVTSEYRTGTIRTTFLATPNRTVVLCAKAAVTAALAGIFAAIMVIASILVAKLLVAPELGERLTVSHAATWRPVGAIGLYAALGAVLAVGLGALLRHAAVVIAILVLLPFVVEPLLGAMPRVGERVGPLLPFANAFTFTEIPWFQGFSMWWGPLGALAYFTAVVVVVFAAAVIVINHRDA
jgi:ABC-2 type transport system permease protein